MCVNIDMNDRFPAFRSRLRRGTVSGVECYLPSLEEYGSPFKNAGFEIVQKGNFCWIPHSAGRGLTAFCAFMSPMLNLSPQPSHALTRHCSKARLTCLRPRGHQEE